MTGPATAHLSADAKLELVRLNNTRWFDQAACVGAPFEWFDVPRDAARRSVKVRAEQEAQAKAICARCPVVEPCRRDAEILHDPSIRGGMTRRERDNARKAAS